MQPKHSQPYFTALLFTIVSGFLDSPLLADQADKPNHETQEYDPVNEEKQDLPSPVRNFLTTYRAHLKGHAPDNRRLLLSDRDLLIGLGRVLDQKNGFFVDFYGKQDFL